MLSLTGPINTSHLVCKVGAIFINSSTKESLEQQHERQRLTCHLIQDRVIERPFIFFFMFSFLVTHLPPTLIHTHILWNNKLCFNRITLYVKHGIFKNEIPREIIFISYYFVAFHVFCLICRHIKGAGFSYLILCCIYYFNLQMLLFGFSNV